jgi:hypothetical protein
MPHLEVVLGAKAELVVEPLRREDAFLVEAADYFVVLLRREGRRIEPDDDAHEILQGGFHRSSHVHDSGARRPFGACVLTIGQLEETLAVIARRSPGTNDRSVRLKAAR